MKLKTLILTLESNSQIREDAAKLRGFFATKFNEYVLLHHHIADRFIYRYPLIQYKMINGSPMVLGINEGIEVLKDIYDKYDSIRLGEREYQIVERRIRVKEQEFGLSREFHRYRFISSWFALNQENYERYLGLNRVEKRQFLQRTLIGNILSMAKGLGYFVPNKIKADVRVFKSRKRVSLKGMDISCFNGKFITNFTIPDYLGIGKSVSRGFGTVKRRDS